MEVKDEGATVDFFSCVLIFVFGYVFCPLVCLILVLCFFMAAVLCICFWDYGVSLILCGCGFVSYRGSRSADFGLGVRNSSVCCMALMNW